MRHQMLYAACAAAMLAGPMALAADKGEGAGKAADLLDKAGGAGEAPALPPEVEAQLAAAADNLESAKAEAEGLKGDLADALKALDAERAIVAELRKANDALTRDYNAAVDALDAARKAAKGKPGKAPRVAEPGKVRVEVLKGTVKHPEAAEQGYPEGRVPMGGAFQLTATSESVAEFTALAERGIVSLASDAED